MAYTDIDKPSDYFETKLYTGNGGTLNVTGLDFAPNWVWIKSRTSTRVHCLFDTVRGATKRLQTNEADTEYTTSNSLTGFNSDGFSLGSYNQSNEGSASFASWNWKAGTSFTNDASSTGIGSIDSAGSVNTDAGFSIITYTGTGSAGTIAHGLGVAPKFIINRTISAAKEWDVYYGDPTDYLVLNTTAATVDASDKWNDTAPTSTVWSVESSSQNNTSGGTCLAYCFAEKQGYSKFGSYVGNGNADGTFVHLGFKPAWFMLKKTSATDPWLIYDDKRSPINQAQANLQANSSNAEVTNTVYLDFLSNGVKFRNTDNDGNLSGGTYIYVAFASNPFVTSTGIPTPAR
jgi:hypothetical protein